MKNLLFSLIVGGWLAYGMVLIFEGDFNMFTWTVLGKVWFLFSYYFFCVGIHMIIIETNVGKEKNSK